MPSDGKEDAREVTPEEFARCWQERIPGQYRGVNGRFIRGTTEEEFEKLSDEPGKRLSWVCTPALLSGCAGLAPAAALLRIGFGPSWIRARLQDGTRFKLAVFPASGGTVATWDGVFGLVRDVYGAEAHERIVPFREEVERRSQDEIDPAGIISELNKLPVSEKIADERFISIERFLAIPKEEVTAYDVRAFLNHTIGCNKYFQGTGMNSRGEPEVLQPNRRIRDIPGAVVVDLDFSAEDLVQAEWEASLQWLNDVPARREVTPDGIILHGNEGSLWETQERRRANPDWPDVGEPNNLCVLKQENSVDAFSATVLCEPVEAGDQAGLYAFGDAESWVKLVVEAAWGGGVQVAFAEQVEGQPFLQGKVMLPTGPAESIALRLTSEGEAFYRPHAAVDWVRVPRGRGWLTRQECEQAGRERGTAEDIGCGAVPAVAAMPARWRPVLAAEQWHDPGARIAFSGIIVRNGQTEESIIIERPVAQPQPEPESE